MGLLFFILVNSGPPANGDHLIVLMYILQLYCYSVPFKALQLCMRVYLMDKVQCVLCVCDSLVVCVCVSYEHSTVGVVCV